MISSTVLIKTIDGCFLSRKGKHVKKSHVSQMQKTKATLQKTRTARNKTISKAILGRV